MNEPIIPSKRKFPKFFWIFILVFLFFFAVIFIKAYNTSSKVFVNKTSFIKKLSNVIFHGSASVLQGESQDRVNILLLGYGGEGHDGSYLTDTIIVMSIKPSTKEVLLSSVPRDYLWQQGSAKLNFAYASGYEKNKSHNEAGQKALKAVNDITGLKIPYFASVDFSGFEKAVDRIGGLDINVERTFTDAEYPNDKFGYLPAITFYAGPQTMDGKKALIFARSRHGNNGEDSDFARSKRQALILEAFKKKVESLNLLSNSGAINDLINIFADHAHTNLEPSDILRLQKLLKGDAKVYSLSIDDSSGLICSEKREIEGYVLKPCEGMSDQDVKNYFKAGFNLAAIGAEKPSVIIENAGTNYKLYNQIKQQLILAGAEVYETPYKGLPLKQSTLYKISDKPATIKYLEDILDLKAQQKPDQMKASSDLVLLVGNR